MTKHITYLAFRVRRMFLRCQSLYEPAVLANDGYFRDIALLVVSGQPEPDPVVDSGALSLPELYHMRHHPVIGQCM